MCLTKFFFTIYQRMQLFFFFIYKKLFLNKFCERVFQFIPQPARGVYRTLTTAIPASHVGVGQFDDKPVWMSCDDKTANLYGLVGVIPTSAAPNIQMAWKVIGTCWLEFRGTK